MTKYTILLSAILTLASFSSTAGTDCKKDWRGVIVCTQTGQSQYGSNQYGSRYRTETKRDWRGYDVTTDNRGNKVECKTDWRGHYVCN